MTLFHTLVKEGLGFTFSPSSAEGQLWAFLLMGYLLTEEKTVASKKKSTGVEPRIN